MIRHPDVGASSGRPVKGGSRTAWHLGLCYLLVWGVLLPVVFVAQPAGRSPGGAVAACCLISLWASLRLAETVVRGTPAIFAISFWSFVLVFLGYAPITAITLGVWALVPPPADQLLPAALLVLASLLAFELGARLNRRRRRRDAVPPAAARSSEIAYDRLVALAVGGSALTLLCIRLVGWSAVFSSRSEFQALVDAQFGEVGAQAFQAVLRYPVFIAAAGLLYVRAYRTGTGRLLTGLAVLLAAAAANPLSAPRFVVGNVLLTLLFCWRRPTVRAGRWLALGFPTALLVVFPYADLYRAGAASLHVTSLSVQLVTSGDYDAFQAIAHGLAYVVSQGHRFGMQLLGALLFFVPRGVWPAKPVSTGTDVAQFAGYDFLNVSSPLWLEWYVDFGVLGVLVGFGLLGYYLTRGDQLYAVAITVRHAWWGLLAPALAFNSVILYRGSLLSQLPGLVAIVLCCLLVRARPRHGRSDSREPVGREAVPAQAAH